jgi:ABC-type polysaccharide/polyol phosphate transport system ATPase subunit
VAVRRHVAYLPAEAAMFPHMRGREALRFFAEIRPGGDVRRSQRLAERLELDLSQKVSFMSTGMKQKLALAATLSAETPIYILVGRRQISTRRCGRRCWLVARLGPPARQCCSRRTCCRKSKKCATASSSCDPASSFTRGSCRSSASNTHHGDAVRPAAADSDA